MPDTDGYPNLHVAQHLPETMRDYGPPSGLTCFGFERLNKVVGDTNISNRNIEHTFALSSWRADQLAMLPHVTGEWTAWSAAEKDLYRAMHGHATALASDAKAGGAEASIAEQVASDRSRAAPVMVHETAVFSEVVHHFYVRPRPLPAEVPAEVQARRAVMAHERERKKRARPARSSGLSLHLGPDDDDCDEGGDERAAQAAAPHVPGESKRSSAAPAPAAAVPLGSLPPRLRLTGAEPFVGRLVLPPAPEPRSRGLYGLPAEPRKPKPARHALDLDAAAADDNAKRSAKKKADSSLHAELVSYFSRIYRCAHKTAAGVVVPPEPSHPQPRVPPGKDRAAWVAAWRAARGAAAPTEGQFAHFELSPVCPQSKRLQFFNQQIGTASSRLKKSSWVMVLSGTRICPARCLDFVEPTITLTRTDGTVLAPLTHRLVKLRSAVPNPSFPFLFHFSPPPPVPLSLHPPLLASLLLEVAYVVAWVCMCVWTGGSAPITATTKSPARTRLACVWTTTPIDCGGKAFAKAKRCLPPGHRCRPSSRASSTRPTPRPRWCSSRSLIIVSCAIGCGAMDLGRRPRAPGCTTLFSALVPCLLPCSYERAHVFMTVPLFTLIRCIAAPPAVPIALLLCAGACLFSPSFAASLAHPLCNAWLCNACAPLQSPALLCLC